MDENEEFEFRARAEREAAAAARPKAQLSDVSKANAEEKYDPTEGQNFLENAALGLGRSGYHAAERITNLGSKLFGALGSKNDAAIAEGTGFGSDKDLASREETDKPLLDTGGGTVGNLVGDVGLTAPIGEVGAAMKAAGLARAAVGGSRLARAVGAFNRSGVARGAVEGALQGAETGDSESGAGTGAVFGGALGGAGTAVRKLASGLVEKSGAANVLEAEAAKSGRKIFLPLSLGASHEDIGSNVAGNIYHGLNYVPGADAQLGRQTREAMDTVREIAAEKASPAGFKATGFANEKDRVKAIKDEFDNVYDNTVKKYRYDVPTDFRDQVLANIDMNMPGVDNTTRQKIATLVDQHMARFADGKAQITGQNLLNARNAANREFKGLLPNEKKALGHGIDTFEDIIDHAAANTTDAQKIADIAKYKTLATPYKNFVAYSKAVNAARVKGGKFTAAQLARAADHDKTSDLYNLGTAAHEAIQDGSSSSRGKVLSNLSRYGLSGWGLLAHPHIAATSLGIGNIMATKTAQRALTGELGGQAALSAALKKRYADEVMGAGRRAILSAAVD